MAIRMFAERIKALRKDAGLSQETVADRLGVSVQAVSKWECALSYPDIELIPELSELFGVTTDYLLKGEQTDAAAGQAIGDLPDDGVLRVVQCRGGQVLQKNTYDPNVKIPLRIDETDDKPLQIEIWGSADIEGNITGEISAGGTISCGDIDGDASAGGTVNCNNVSGDASAGGGVYCGNVEGDVSSGSGVQCGNIRGDVDANGDVTCGDIGGDVSCGGNLNCRSIDGEIEK